MLRDVMGAEQGGDAAQGLAGAAACSGDPSHVVTPAACHSGPPEPCEPCRAPVTQMSLMCGFRSVRRAELRAKSQPVPPVP